MDTRVIKTRQPRLMWDEISRRLADGWCVNRVWYKRRWRWCWPTLVYYVEFKRQPRLEFLWGPISNRDNLRALVERARIMPQLVLTDTQKVSFGFQGRTAAGNPVAVRDVRVDSSDAELLTVEGPDEDGKFTASVTGRLGHVQLNAVATVDDDQLYGTAEIEIIPGRAIAISFDFGDPAEIEIDDGPDGSITVDPDNDEGAVVDPSNVQGRGLG